MHISFSLQWVSSQNDHHTPDAEGDLAVEVPAGTKRTQKKQGGASPAKKPGKTC